MICRARQSVSVGPAIQIALAFFLLSLFPMAYAQDQKIPTTKTVLSHDNEAFAGLWETFWRAKTGNYRLF